MSRITVVTPDRAGLIADLTEKLSAHRLNITSFNARTVGHDAVLSLDVDDLDKALSTLTEAGFQAITDDVVLVQMDDVPGALAQVARRLTDAQLDIRAVRVLTRSAQRCVAALATDDNARARQELGACVL